MSKDNATMTEPRFVFIGTYTEPIRFGTGKILVGKGEGIYIYQLDLTSGALTPHGLASGAPNPSYLAFHPSRRFLYAVNELKEFEGAASGAISAFALDPDNGELTFLNIKPTHGTDPCHLAVHPTGRYVLVANFMSGSVCVLPIAEDGSLGDATDFIQHKGSSIDPVRQAGPHAHAVTLDASGRYVFVPDLGLDRVIVYKFDAEQGKLMAYEEAWVETAPGAGPRQLVMHPQGPYAYLINELDSTMTAYRFDPDQGTLHAMQTLSTLPKDFTGASTCAEVQIHPSGRFLYGSNRGHDSLVIYTIDHEVDAQHDQAKGALTVVGHESTLGKTPRNFVIDPTGRFALVANQDTDTIVVFSLDSTSGKLKATGHSIAVPTPVCVKVL
jgi:6-phosphogluconolactonase